MGNVEYLLMPKEEWLGNGDIQEFLQKEYGMRSDLMCVTEDHNLEERYGWMANNGSRRINRRHQYQRLPRAGILAAMRVQFRDQKLPIVMDQGSHSYVAAGIRGNGAQTEIRIIDPHVSAGGSDEDWARKTVG